MKTLAALKMTPPPQLSAMDQRLEQISTSRSQASRPHHKPKHENRSRSQSHETAPLPYDKSKHPTDPHLLAFAKRSLQDILRQSSTPKPSEATLEPTRAVGFQLPLSGPAAVTELPGDQLDSKGVNPCSPLLSQCESQLILLWTGIQGNEKSASPSCEKISSTFHVQLEESKVPNGWSNHPTQLSVNNNFTELKNDHAKIALQHDFGIPNSRPILVNKRRTYLIDGGNQKYYTWNDVRDEVNEVRERNLEKILTTLSSARGGECSGLGREYLGTLKYDALEDALEYVREAEIEPQDGKGNEEEAQDDKPNEEEALKRPASS